MILLLLIKLGMEQKKAMLISVALDLIVGSMFIFKIVEGLK